MIRLPRTIEEAAESWRRRFGYQALALCRRHAAAHEPGEHREFWFKVVALLARDLHRGQRPMRISKGD